MKQTIASYKKLIIGFFILFVPLMTLAFFPMKYTLLAPGFTDDVSDFIVIENGEKETGSFHTTSVIQLQRISVYQYLLSKINHTVTATPYPDYYDNLDINDLDIMSYLMKDDSLQTSLINGILKTSEELTYESHLTVYLTYRHLSPNTLEIGDQIISVNGSDDILGEIYNLSCEDSAIFEVRRDNEIMEFTVSKNKVNETTCSIGIALYYYSEILETSVEYSLIDTNTGGPSGGLLQALYVYNELTEFDYSHGLKIGGTGTINIDGSVGYIGGIRQKIITAIHNHIDVFFVPHLTDLDNDNYIEALKTYNTFETDMILVGVSTFDEALLFLEEYGGGQE
ncbi:MAG: hypothetical protein JXR62_01900 [Bacilli bacterium]|nr:hypothetical protein [Bacilli bacterium]